MYTHFRHTLGGRLFIHDARERIVLGDGTISRLNDYWQERAPVLGWTKAEDHAMCPARPLDTPIAFLVWNKVVSTLHLQRFVVGEDFYLAAKLHNDQLQHLDYDGYQLTGFAIFASFDGQLWEPLEFLLLFTEEEVAAGEDGNDELLMHILTAFKYRC